ncbi:profilin [Moelleriella libera RCEF 2490]|uniref:Profilin n=1 Tax=Moelleriella libera RCEF 2490 TaxID=1081109 RepID=A0A167XT10_9HYPO|nr:profilin [Moelleriella libera RCEF 2490]
MSWQGSSHRLLMFAARRLYDSSRTDHVPLAAYVDTSLVASGHVDKGAIISAAGDSAWASSANFQLKPEEMKAIAAIVGGDDAAKDKAFADGLYIAGERYVMARADGRSVYARQGRLGVAIAKTKQAIVIGHHGEAQVAGNTSSTVEGLADYLVGQGY